MPKAMCKRKMEVGLFIQKKTTDENWNICPNGIWLEMIGGMVSISLHAERYTWF